MKLSVFVLCITAFVCNAERITESADGLTINVGAVPVFKHSYANPMVYVGNGKTNFQEFRGNFRIQTDIDRRIGLRNYTRQQLKGTDEIVFTEDNFQIKLVLSTNAASSVNVNVYNLGDTFDYIWIRMVADPTEQVYGGGEQFTHLNLRENTYSIRDPERYSATRAKDQIYPIWTREQGVGRDKSNQVTFAADKMDGAGGEFHTTYFPQPSFISSRKYSFHYTGYNYMEFDFSHSSYHEVFIKGNVSQITLTPGNSTMNLVQNLASQVGKMAEIPEWLSEGAIIGIQGGTDVMLKTLAAAQAQDVAVNGLWIQDWAGIKKTSFGQRLFWNWKWNSTQYPGLDQKIKDLKAQGIRVLAYINPNLNIEGDLYKSAASQGLVVKNRTGQPYLLDFGEFLCGIVDLTNPAAFDWYKGQIKTNMIDLGLGGWMADFGEYLPVDAVVHDTSMSIESVHNQWPLLWAKLNRQAVEESGKLGEIVFWMRAGAAGISNYTTLMWAGDQNVDFSYGDGLPSTVIAATSMGVSGTGLTHFDIGGYTTFGTLGLRRSPELLLRSAEMAVFTPAMRTHEGNQPQANVQVYSSDYMLKQFGRLVTMFKMLSNYSRTVVDECVNQGIPAQRPLVLHYENDPKAVNAKYQYMYGPDLLIAPVIQANVTSQKVYLPKGNWVFLWDSTTQSKGQEIKTVPAPIGKPPVFYKKSSRFASTFNKIGQIPLVPPPPTVKPLTTTISANTGVSKSANIAVFIIPFCLCYLKMML